MDSYRNPVSPVDSWGQVYPAYDTPKDLNRRGEIASHIVLVDSRARNRNQWPNANNFEVSLPTPLKYVYSVELLSAIVPIPASGAPGWGGRTPRYFVIKSRQLQQLEGGQTTNPAQTAFLSPAGLPLTYTSNITNDAFVDLPILNNFPSHFGAAPTAAGLYWRKSEYRVIKRYFPPIENLAKLDFQLRVRDELQGEYAWPFTNENPDPSVATSPELNIVLKFEIVGKN